MKRNASFFGVLMVLIIICTEAYAGIAVITEIGAAGGTVEIRKAGQRDWVKASPLQSLDQGDVMRASDKAYAVILSAAGGRALKITAANSPYEVKRQDSQDGKAVKAQIVVNKLIDFMTGKTKESLSMPLAVRSSSPPGQVSPESAKIAAPQSHLGWIGTLQRSPGLISPNNSKILSAQPLFEWIGTPRIPYGIKVILHDAPVWQKEKIYRTRISYPAEAKPLVPGQRYIWEIGTAEYPSVSAWFEVATDNERKGLEEEMRVLEEPEYLSLPQSARAMLKYDILVSKGFHAEARNVLLAAILSNPDVPLLHILLGDFYEYSGLRDLAAEEYDEADFLMSIQQ